MEKRALKSSTRRVKTQNQNSKNTLKLRKKKTICHYLKNKLQQNELQLQNYESKTLNYKTGLSNCDRLKSSIIDYTSFKIISQNLLSDQRINKFGNLGCFKKHNAQKSSISFPQKSFKKSLVERSSKKNLPVLKNAYTPVRTTRQIQNQVSISSEKIKDSFSTRKIFVQLNWICQNITQNLYSYEVIEQSLLNFIQIIQKITIQKLKFQGFSTSATIFQIYGNYSLAVYFFDKALKQLYVSKDLQQDKTTINQQFKIFKSLTKIFIHRMGTKLSKQFAYKCLRLSWLLKSVDRQLQAYDLLGQVYHSLEIKQLSLYFHSRMCSGVLQSDNLVKQSNFQLSKRLQEDRQVPVYEAVDFFIEKDSPFNEMLENHYLVQSKINKEGQDYQFYFHTHRSHNRNLNNFYNLERRLITNKKSIQLHFITPKQAKKIKFVLRSLQIQIKKQAYQQGHLANQQKDTYLNIGVEFKQN